MTFALSKQEKKTAKILKTNFLFFITTWQNYKLLYKMKKAMTAGQHSTGVISL